MARFTRTYRLFTANTTSSDINKNPAPRHSRCLWRPVTENPAVNHFPKFSRRNFLGTSALSLAAPAMLYRAKPQRPKVAAVYTSFTHRSHAHVILENFLHPYLFNGQHTDPNVDVVSFYADRKSVV
jgi:hypothetical protein